MVIIEPELNDHLLDRLRNKMIGELGRSEFQELPLEFQNALNDALIAIQRQTQPKGIFCMIPVLGVGAEGVKTETGTIRSAMFARQVERCEGERFVIFMISTLGKELEPLHNHNESVLNQWIFDKIGTDLAELVADLVEQEWKSRVNVSGMQCGVRFSPGYCDWPLEGQSIIFNAIEAGIIGVKLTAKFIMLPKKSVSAVAVAAQKVHAKTPCEFCIKKDCLWRRSTNRCENILSHPLKS
jgi:hypothetical protein